MFQATSLCILFNLHLLYFLSLLADKKTLLIFFFNINEYIERATPPFPNNKIDVAKPVKGISRGRARERQKQRSKGRQKGHSTRKGKKTARLPKKEGWMKKIRNQRKFLKELKDKKIIDTRINSDLRLKAKGGFFRSKRHIKVFLDKIKK